MAAEVVGSHHTALETSGARTGWEIFARIPDGVYSGQCHWANAGSVWANLAALAMVLLPADTRRWWLAGQAVTARTVNHLVLTLW